MWRQSMAAVAVTVTIASVVSNLLLTGIQHLRTWDPLARQQTAAWLTSSWLVVTSSGSKHYQATLRQQQHKQQ